MAEYVKQVWEDGVSPVNAERLNYMEDGIANAGGSGGGGGVLTVNITYDDDKYIYIADKTYDEIEAAMKQGQYVQALWAVSGEDNEHSKRYYAIPLTYVSEPELYGKIYKIAHFISVDLYEGALIGTDLKIWNDGKIEFDYTA